MNPPFDASAPLPPPPDPWQPSTAPSARSGPPFHMTEMIAAEPAVAGRLLARLADPESGAAALAAAVRETLTAGRTVVFTGCGTSEHGAFGAADIVRDVVRDAGLRAGPGSVVAAQAFELALDPPADGLVVGVSHEGGSWATNRALEASRGAGARTALITAGAGSPGAALADVLVTTGEMDQSWCHTVGYLAPLVAAVAVGGHLSGLAVAADRVTALLQASPSVISAAEAVAARIAAARQLVVIASGSDRTAGRELVLKVEEAAWIPSAFRDLETFLHGHLPATDDTTALVLVLAERDAREARIERARQALAAGRAVGVQAAAIVTESVDAGIERSLTPAGRLVVPEAPDLAAPAAALLSTLVPLQLLTERVARTKGTNPDPIRRDDTRYREAAAAAE